MGLFSSITDAIGLTDTKGEKAAAAQAAANAEKGWALSKEQIEYMKEKDARWNEIYGTVEENLGTYFNELNPDDVATQGLEKLQLEYQTVQKALEKETMARGTADDDLTKYVGTMGRFDLAKGRATIKANAEKAVREEQQKFVGLGTGQASQVLAGMNTAYGTGINFAQAQSSQYLDRSTQLRMANLEATRGLAKSAISGGTSNFLNTGSIFG